MNEAIFWLPNQCLDLMSRTLVYLTCLKLLDGSRLLQVSLNLCMQLFIECFGAEGETPI